MSDISGGQSTGTTELFVKVDGEASKGFLDIVKTLQDLGAYVDSSVELLGRFEEKINNIGTAADNINKKTRKYSAKSAVQIGRNKKAVTVLNDVPTDATPPAGRQGIQMLRSQKQLIDAQKALTEALEDATKASIATNETMASAMAMNAETRKLGEPSRIRTRNTWSDMIYQSTDFRNTKNAFEANLYNSGYKDREANQKEILRSQQIERGRYFSDRRNYDSFRTGEVFKNFLRQRTNRIVNSNTFGGAFGQIGALINPKESLQKTTTAGGLLKGTGVVKGGAIFGLVADAVAKLVQTLEKLAHTSLAAYGTVSKLETSLGVVYGSQTQAESVFNEIANYAIKSPFGVEQLTEMATLLKQSGIYESDLMDTLKTIGDLAGGNEEKYRRIANNYAQVLAIGKATTKDMREFANAGIPIFDATADYLGVSRKNLSSEIEAGNITAQVLEGVFKQLTSEGGLFYKATEKNAETYNARKTNLEDIKQLALAEVGEALYSGAVFGDYGKSSWAKTFMEVKENFFEMVGEIFSNRTQKESYKATEDNSKRIKELTQAINDSLSKIDSLDAVNNFVELENELAFLQSARSALEAEKQMFSEDELQRILTSEYDSIMERTGNKTAYDAQAMAFEIASLQEEYQRLSDLIYNNSSNMSYEEVLSVGSEQAKLLNEISELNHELETIQKELERITPEIAQANALRTLETASRQMSDSINKNQSYNKNSMSSYNAYIEDAYLQTDAYKQEVEARQEQIIKDIGNAIKEKETLGITEDGLNFLSNIATEDKPLSREKFSEYLGKFFTGESLSFEKNDLANTIPEVKRNLEKMMLVELSETERTFLNSLKSSIPANNQYSDPVSMTQFLGIINNAKTNEALQEILGLISVGYKQIDLSDKYDAVKAQKEKDKANKSAAFSPLWAKIAGDIFDVPASMLEWTSFQTKYDNHDSWNHGYALETYKTGIYDNGLFDPNKARGSMISRNGVEALLRASGTDYLNNLVFAKDIAGKDIFREYKDDKGNVTKVKQYDWDESFKSLEEIALSVKSSTEMTTALANYYKTEREKFTSYATEGIIAKEDWANLLNPEYTAEMGLAGQAFDQLKNALSAEYTVLEDGTIQLTHAGMQIALEMEKMLEPMETLTGQFNTLKQSIAGVITSTEQTNLKSYAVRNQLFGQGLSLEQQASLAETAYSVISEELNKLDLDETQRDAYLKQSTDFISRAVSGEDLNTTETTLTPEAALVEAIQKMIEATQGNTDAILGLEISNAFYKPSLDGKLSADVFTLFTSGEVGRTDIFGDSAKQQRIKATFGASDYSYDQFKEVLKGEKFSRVRSDIEKSTGISIGANFENLDKALDAFSKMEIASKNIEDAFANLTNGSLDALKDFVTDAFTKPFEKLGEEVAKTQTNLKNTGKESSIISQDFKDAFDSSTELNKAWKEIGANFTSQISTLLVTTGLEIAGNAAIMQNWGMVAVGLGMVAAGGIGSFFSGMLSYEDKDKDKDKEVEKLKSLKEALADLLAQARIDAEYYERNLRHQYAISANEKLSEYSVNDAIITPKGDIISTHPDDWLIATKTPHELAGGGAAPIVTITIVNESGSQVAVARTEQTQRGNEIDVKAIIVATTNEALAMGGLDSGMQAYQQRQQGRVFTR